MYYNEDRGGSFGDAVWGGVGRSRQPYNRGNNYRYDSRNNGNGQRAKKHSGAKYHASTKNGNPCITAWNYSRRNGMVSVFIAPYSGTKRVKSSSGKEWDVWMCKINGKSVAERHFPVLVNVAERKAIIKDFGWVVNCNAPNGGYTGTFTKK